MKQLFYLLLGMKYSYLALGDSYTIGEQVTFEQNFPNQTVDLLRKTPSAVVNPDGGLKENKNQTAAGADSPRQGLQIATPQIIAQTGWTTDELDAAITAAAVTKQFDIVSLLIGVNNQFRGRSVSNFKIEFGHLLQRSIQFAGNKPNHVFVLSIPDWGVTPFAEGRNRKQIAAEIDAYNLVCESGAKQFETHFINITLSQRKDGNKDEFLAPDKLHPSVKEYAKWAIKLSEAIKNEFGK